MPGLLLPGRPGGWWACSPRGARVACLVGRSSPLVGRVEGGVQVARCCGVLVVKFRLGLARFPLWCLGTDVSRRGPSGQDIARLCQPSSRTRDNVSGQDIARLMPAIVSDER